MTGKFVNGAWVKTPIPRYTVTAIAEWIISAESVEEAYKVAATRVPNDCWEWEAEQRYYVTRICPHCRSTNYTYDGIHMSGTGNDSMCFCEFHEKWRCNDCGYSFSDGNCELIKVPESEDAAVEE